MNATPVEVLRRLLRGVGHVIVRRVGWLGLVFGDPVLGWVLEVAEDGV